MKNLLKMLPAFILLISACNKPTESTDESTQLLKISENKHFFVKGDSTPFFWLGDTGWLLFNKLKQEEAEEYLEDRKQKGFNVIQVMVLHDLNNAVNVYGDSALINKDISTPKTTEGNSFEDAESYDFWDNIDYVINLAEKKGLYMALVPLWGSNVKNSHVNKEKIAKYGTWLANRYKDHKNIIWLNGGDTYGSDSTDLWNALGNAINNTDTNHLITFHPRGRMQSSMWFHNEPWLDFNMVQSGHRNYEQDDTELNYGEDNWRYIQTDYKLQPSKPTIDGEPSYEGIPQGLHNTLQPFWNAADVRRYGYWSVFAGAFGYTYGHSAVMQFYNLKDKEAAYGAKMYWEKALDEKGACQMGYLKELMLSRPYFERIPDQTLIAGEQGKRYDYLIATRGETYAFIYTYTGRDMLINMGKIEGEKVIASWFNPRTGKTEEIGVYENTGVANFTPPGKPKNGNDWVLVLDTVK